MRLINEILDFWFVETKEAQWFSKDKMLDTQIKQRFLTVHNEAVSGAYNHWQDMADGALALVLVLDQFSRNLYRGTPKAYAYDDKAVAVSKLSIERGFHQSMPDVRKRFLYMPFMHSENLENQKQSVALFKSLGGAEKSVDYAIKHMEIIEKFGRFPYRNKTLGRKTTDEEAAWLADPDRVRF